MISGARCIIFAAWLITVAQAQDIKLEDPRAQIRAQLLKMTPPGTDAREVLAFIAKRLQEKDAAAPPLENHPAHTPSTEGSDKKGVKSIRLVLGKYLANPILLTLSPPIAMEREVDVEWTFDAKEKLVEIFVDKHTEGY